MSTPSKSAPVTREELRDALDMVLGCYCVAMQVLGRNMQDFERSSDVVTARALLARLDAEGK